MPRRSGGAGEGLVVRVDAGRLPRLPADVEVAAYRIAQESLTNVLRHADARHVQVRLAAEGDTLRVEIVDDGSGLDEALTAGVEVRSMRHRAESLEGTLDVTSTGHGTKVVAGLPLTERAP